MQLRVTCQLWFTVQWFILVHDSVHRAWEDIHEHTCLYWFAHMHAQIDPWQAKWTKLSPRLVCTKSACSILLHWDRASLFCLLLKLLSNVDCEVALPQLLQPSWVPPALQSAAVTANPNSQGTFIQAAQQEKWMCLVSSIRTGEHRVAQLVVSPTQISWWHPTHPQQRVCWHEASSLVTATAGGLILLSCTSKNGTRSPVWYCSFQMYYSFTKKA